MTIEEIPPIQTPDPLKKEIISHEELDRVIMLLEEPITVEYLSSVTGHSTRHLRSILPLHRFHTKKVRDPYSTLSGPASLFTVWYRFPMKTDDPQEWNCTLHRQKHAPVSQEMASSSGLRPDEIYLLEKYNETDWTSKSKLDLHRDIRLLKSDISNAIYNSDKSQFLQLSLTLLSLLAFYTKTYSTLAPFNPLHSETEETEIEE